MAVGQMICRDRRPCNGRGRRPDRFALIDDNVIAVAVGQIVCHDIAQCNRHGRRSDRFVSIGDNATAVVGGQTVLFRQKAMQSSCP